MRHHLHVCCGGEFDNTWQFSVAKAVFQGKEIIRGSITPRQNAVNASAVGSVYESLFFAEESEVPPDFGACGDDFIHQQITAQMHVLVAVDVRGRDAVQAAEFGRLRFVNRPELLSQPWVIEQAAVFARVDEANDPGVRRRQGLGSGRGVRLAEIKMQANRQTVL
jgi:hypothetical protein